MSDQRKKCQRINGRAVKRGPYPNANGWRFPEFVFASAQAKIDSVLRHRSLRRIIEQGGKVPA